MHGMHDMLKYSLICATFFFIINFSFSKKQKIEAIMTMIILLGFPLNSLRRTSMSINKVGLGRPYTKSNLIVWTNAGKGEEV